MTTPPTQAKKESTDDIAERVQAWLNRPYVWPVVNGVKLPRGDCSVCQTRDKRHPDGAACDYSCVGI